MALVLGVSSGFVITAPTADPTGGSSATIDGSSVVTKHTAPTGATITIVEIGWYRNAGTSTANFEVGLYAESAGIAATRLQVDATNSSTSGGWTVVTGLSWAVTENTAYWLGVQMDSHAGSSAIDSEVSGGVGMDIKNSQTTLTDPYGGTTVSDADGMFAIYAKITIVQNRAPAVGAATFEGFAPTVVATDNKNIAADLGIATYNGFVPTVVGGSGSPVNVSPSVGALVATGFTPIVAASNEYQVLLDRATTLTYGHPTAGQKIKQNRLLSAIKSAGVLPDIDVMWIFATDGDSDFATLNWITPASFQCTKVNSPNFAPNQGYNGNGSTSYLNTNWATLDAVQATISSVSYLVVVDDWPGTAGVEFGTGGYAINFSIHYQEIKLIDGGTNYSPEPGANGTWAANRNGTDINGYKNNNLIKNATVATQSLHQYPIWIGAINAGPSGEQFISTLVRCLIIGKSLDSTKRTALYNAVTAYLASIIEVFPDDGVATFNGFAPTVSVTNNLNVAPSVGVGLYEGFLPVVTATDHKNILADFGVATFSGFEPTVSASAGTNVNPSVGEVALNGFEPTVSISNHINIITDVGAGLYLGFAPTVFTSDHKNIIADIGVGTFNGFAPTVITPLNIITDVGVITATGFLPVVSATAHQNILPSVGVGLYEGFAPTITTPINIVADIGVCTYNSFAPTIATPINLNADVGTLTYIGFAPTVSTPIEVLPGVGQATLNGFAPSLVLPRNITVGVGAGVWTGFAPVVEANAGQGFFPGFGIATYTGFNPTVSLSDNKNIAIGLGEVVANGFAPTVIVSDHKNITIGLGQATFTGFNPTIVASDHKIVTPAVGEMVMVGYNPTIFIGDFTEVTPSTGELVMAGYIPSISIDLVPVAPVNVPEPKRKRIIYLE